MNVKLTFREEYQDVFGVALMLAGSPSRWDLVYWQNVAAFGEGPLDLSPGTELDIHIPDRRRRVVVLPRNGEDQDSPFLGVSTPGETVRMLAERELGHQALHHYLREAEGNDVPDSGVLAVGQVLHVPSLILPAVAKPYWRRLKALGVRLVLDRTA